MDEKKTILVVDDDLFVREVLIGFLEQEGFATIEASAPEVALRVLQVHSPDLILLDIRMPGMDGFELCRRLKQLEATRRIPVIFISAMQEIEDRCGAFRAGGVDYIMKPFHEAEVLARVRTHLSLCQVDDLKQEIRERVQVEAALRQNETKLQALYQQLQAQSVELQKAHGYLEQRVAQRTQELTDSLQSLKAETAERVRAVEALREKEQLLLQQSRHAAMGEMINNIAHQWRQPLNSLGLLVQQTLVFHEFGQVNQQYLEENAAQCMNLIRHMSQTVEDFRNFFKPDKEKMRFELSEVLRKTLSLADGSLKGRQITVEVAAGDQPSVDGYPNEFSQAVLNILINARDAFIERCVQPARIAVGIAAQEGRAVVTITDNAGGIEAGIIDKIFDPYFTTKGPQQGTGVGLFMSKTIIERNMGGSLTVCNVEGGAQFRIEMPLPAGGQGA